MTSSVLAILALTPGASGPDHVFTEKDWSDAPGLVENGVNSPLVVYCASKALAEKAAWDFIKEKGGKEALGWDYVALNPPFMFGVSTSSLEGSLREVLMGVIGICSLPFMARAIPRRGLRHKQCGMERFSRRA